MPTATPHHQIVAVTHCPFVPPKDSRPRSNNANPSTVGSNGMARSILSTCILSPSPPLSLWQEPDTLSICIDIIIVWIHTFACLSCLHFLFTFLPFFHMFHAHIQFCFASSSQSHYRPHCCCLVCLAWWPLLDCSWCLCVFHLFLTQSLSCSSCLRCFHLLTSSLVPSNYFQSVCWLVFLSLLVSKLFYQSASGSVSTILLLLLSILVHLSSFFIEDCQFKVIHALTVEHNILWLISFLMLPIVSFAVTLSVLLFGHHFML